MYSILKSDISLVLLGASREMATHKKLSDQHYVKGLWLNKLTTDYV